MDKDAAAKRHDQLTTAPNAVESDADPRIDVTEQPGKPTRIDIRDDAAVRPGESVETNDGADADR